LVDILKIQLLLQQFLYTAAADSTLQTEADQERQANSILFVCGKALNTSQDEAGSVKKQQAKHKERQP